MGTHFILVTIAIMAWLPHLSLLQTPVLYKTFVLLLISLLCS
ncbi:hypothetical protein CsSME_00002975 [Camellia sinensis var. sinensis]